MAYNTNEVVKDKLGNPISQYYNPVTDRYEPVEGADGANKVLVENNDLSLIPILDKLSQLTGTVIDEETRKSNELGRISKESARVTTETSRVNAESTRVSNENTRKSNETARQTSESSRVTEEGKRVTTESNRASAESVRVSSENTRKSNEDTRKSQETTRETNEGLRIALYDDLLSKVASGFFKGEKGDTGNGLEYTWNGTQLGVRVEGTTEYVYVDLKGEKGETGDIENLTSSHVTTALGYNPISPTQLSDKVKTDVPSDAKFTDTNTTYSEITTAEIDTGTASTLRTITGRRAKYILDKVQGWISGLTKSDVGLSNVTNDKQMPISGGVLENYREKLATVSATNGSINLSLGNVFQHTPSGNMTYSITNASEQAHSFTLIINMGSTVRTLTFPASAKWQDGEIPDMSTANKTYVLTFVTVDGGTTWLGMSGGEF